MKAVARGTSLAVFPLVFLACIAPLAVSSSARADEPSPSKAASEAFNRPAVHAALKRSDSASVADLSRSGIAADGASLQVGAGSGGPMGAKDGRLATIVGTTTAQGNAVASGRSIDAPKAEGSVARVGRPHRNTRAATSAAPGADRVVASMAPSFAACAKVPDGEGPASDASGIAIIGAAIAPTGEVTSTVVVSSGDFGPAVVTCFRGVIAHAKFDAAAVREPVMQIRVNPRQAAAPAAPASEAPAAPLP